MKIQVQTWLIIKEELFQPRGLIYLKSVVGPVHNEKINGSSTPKDNTHRVSSPGSLVWYLSPPLHQVPVGRPSLLGDIDKWWFTPS